MNQANSDMRLQHGGMSASPQRAVDVSAAGFGLKTGQDCL